MQENSVGAGPGLCRMFLNFATCKIAMLSSNAAKISKSSVGRSFRFRDLNQPRPSTEWPNPVRPIANWKVGPKTTQPDVTFGRFNMISTKIRYFDHSRYSPTQRNPLKTEKFRPNPARPNPTRGSTQPMNNSGSDSQCWICPEIALAYTHFLFLCALCKFSYLLISSLIYYESSLGRTSFRLTPVFVYFHVQHTRSVQEHSSVHSSIETAFIYIVIRYRLIENLAAALL